MKQSKKVALVCPFPADIRSIGSANLGFKIVEDTIKKCGWDVDIYTCEKWFIPYPDSYDIIAFSLFYYGQIINVLPFLEKNNIPLNPKDRKQVVIAGGQGMIGVNTLNNYIDCISMGDCEVSLPYLLEHYDDLELLSKHKNLFVPSINSSMDEKELGFYPYVDTGVVTYGKNATVQLNKGCRFRCKFCGYSWCTKKYIEKPLELVKEQILEAKAMGIKNINLFSVNMCGYSKIIEVLDFMIENGMRLLTTDVRASDYTEEIAERLDKLKVRRLSVGVESFDEDVRKYIRKGLSDKQLDEFFDRAIRHNVSTFHIYLICGLPTEQYKNWNEWVGYIKEKIEKVDRGIRLDFSLANFQPMPKTPLQDEEYVDFKEKHEYIRSFLRKQYEVGLLKQEPESKTYRNLGGRIAQKERSYLVFMYMLHGDVTAGNILEKLHLKSFVGRSLNPKLYDKIRILCKENPDCYQIEELTDSNEEVWDVTDI